LISTTKAAVAVCMAALAVPASASAATKVVTMGPPASAQKTLGQKYTSDVNDFFPHGITIHTGDSVRFELAGFHTVDLPAKGGSALPFITPTTKPATGEVDAAGAPFWFNGQPLLGFNPALLSSKFGKRVTYTGAKQVLSGAFLSNSRPKPFTVKFSKAGSYTYFCNIHHGMSGKVTVKAKSRHVPSAAVDKQRVAAQVARDIGIVKQLAKRTIAPNTVSVGVAGKYGTEYFGMLPAQTTVPVGTTVTFTMSSRSYDDHTATFGPGDITKKTSYIGAIEDNFQNALVPNGISVYPSEAPGGALATLTPTLHGNGFWNTGIIDASSATPVPASGAVTFGAAGTYTFYCLIHPFMKGTVTAQ
jgi:plastocyanin